MVRRKPISVVIEEVGSSKFIVRTYADGHIEREAIVPSNRPRRKHILGVRKLLLDKTRKGNF
jgi:hypothetical protein